MIDRTHIQARRDELQAQLDQARQQYDQLEATLHALDRQLCAMAGGLQELQALLASEEEPCAEPAAS
jgi:chromosome segregation ATPase